MGVAFAVDRLGHYDRAIRPDRRQPSGENLGFEPLDVDLNEIRLQSAVIETDKRQSLG
jgi:hypothetical protein